MRISPQGVIEIETRECGDPNKASLKPYLDSVDIATIGYGHVVLDHNSKRLLGEQGLEAAKSIYPDGITEAQARTLLEVDLAPFERAVSSLVAQSTTQDQFDALVSIAFNVGAGVGGLSSSTLLRLHNAGLRESTLSLDVAVSAITRCGDKPTNAADAFLMWDKAGGRISDGLINRRMFERTQYLGQLAPSSRPGAGQLVAKPDDSVGAGGQHSFWDRFKGWR